MFHVQDENKEGGRREEVVEAMLLNIL